MSTAENVVIGCAWTPSSRISKSSCVRPATGLPVGVGDDGGDLNGFDGRSECGGLFLRRRPLRGPLADEQTAAGDDQRQRHDQSHTEEALHMSLKENIIAEDVGGRR